MAIGFQVTMDCADPGALARFWAELLGYILQPPPKGHDDWESWLTANGFPEDRWNDFSAIVDPDRTGPRMFFQKVPEGKVVKNRVHLDVNIAGGHEVAGDERRRALAEGVARAESIGATRIQEFDDPTGHWVVMTDPEGNEFCLQ